MRPGPLLGGLAGLTAVPGAGLLALIAAGAANPGPALLVLLATLATGFALVLLLAEDLRRLATLLRQAAHEGAPPLGAPPPRLPSLARIGRAIETLARNAVGRVAEMERLSRANAAIIEALPDPLLVLGEDRRLLRANAAAHAAFGGDMAAVLRHPALRAAVERGFSTGKAGSAAVSLSVPARELLASVIPLERTLPDSGRAVLVLSDRTRERAVERMRADFVANASHELRTPLAGLVGFIETLRGVAADDAEAQQRFLGIMAEQAGRMNRLIDDLLSLSRIELSEHQAPADRVELPELTKRVVAGFEAAAAQKGGTLALQLAPGLPHVLADEDQIAQVLQNLIDNALKYGGGRVEIGVAPESGGRFPTRPGVVLRVSDDGPGILPEHVPRLTERFYRVDAGRSRRAGGTGLGLAIVKHIVARHRGVLAIDGGGSGRGASFAVWLPAATEALDAAAGRDVMPDNPSQPDAA